MSSYRIARLEDALENLVECFETGGDVYTIPVLFGEASEPTDFPVTEETTLALEEALNVLYGGECSDSDSDE